MILVLLFAVDSSPGRARHKPPEQRYHNATILFSANFADDGEHSLAEANVTCREREREREGERERERERQRVICMIVIYIYIHVYVYVCMYVCIYIYIYIYYTRLAEPIGKLRATNPRPPQGHIQSCYDTIIRTL